MATASNSCINNEGGTQGPLGLCVSVLPQHQVKALLLVGAESTSDSWLSQTFPTDTHSGGLEPLLVWLVTQDLSAVGDTYQGVCPRQHSP